MNSERDKINGSQPSFSRMIPKNVLGVRLDHIQDETASSGIHLHNVSDLHSVNFGRRGARIRILGVPSRRILKRYSNNGIFSC